MCIKFDSTEMRLFFSLERNVSAQEITARCWSLYDSASSELVAIPDFVRTQGGESTDIATALGLCDFKFETFSIDPCNLRVVVFCMGNAPANRLAMRYINGLMEKYREFVIPVVVCLDHALSNARKWGGVTFPTCDVLRGGHYLKFRPISNIREFCAKQLPLGEIQVEACRLGKSDLL